MAEPVELSQLVAALELDDHELVALVGGGGKTTLLHAIGAGLAGTVVLTCTTKMGTDQHSGVEVLLAPADEAVRDAVAAHRQVMVWNRTEDTKAIGVSPDACDRWFDLVDHVVVEADGSRRHPFKAPAAAEPVVPAHATVVLSVIGADALGRVITDQCHRPLRVAALADCSPADRLTPARATAVLAHERGPRREVPDGARYVVVVTKVDATVRPLVEELVSEAEARNLPCVSVAAFAP